jgi:hypothetical protein
MNRQHSINARDACETLRWIERTRGYMSELERDPRQLEYMQMPAEIRRGVQVSEQSPAQWHGGRVGAVSTQFHAVLV